MLPQTPIRKGVGDMADETYWALVNPRGGILCSTVAATATASIKKHVDRAAWPAMQAKGYRCIRVKIVPVEESENG